MGNCIREYMGDYMENYMGNYMDCMEHMDYMDYMDYMDCPMKHMARSIHFDMGPLLELLPLDLSYLLRRGLH